MLNCAINMISKWKYVSTLTSLIFLVACGDNQIQHCVYGVSDNVQKIEARLCDGAIFPYAKKGNFWESVEVISNPCEYLNVHFRYEDGRTGEYAGLYLSGGGQQITDYDKFSTDDPASIHLVQAARDYVISNCPKEKDVKFLYDFTSGELCDNAFYDCKSE